MTDGRPRLTGGEAWLWLTGLVVMAGLTLVPLPAGQAWSALLNPDSTASLIFFQLRLPRFLLALLVGSALAGAGHLVQLTVRNPLASPDLLGVSAGAGTGALVVLTLTKAGADFWVLPLGAVLGGLAAAGLIFVLSRGAAERNLSLILAGMALSSLLAALSSLLLTFSQEGTVSHYLFWLLGSLENRRWEHLNWAAGLLLPLLVLMLVVSRQVNFFALGQDGARSLGFAWSLWRRLALGTAVVAASVCVALTGAIGFVGLLIPHAIRLIRGEDGTANLPRSLLAGGLFLSLADWLARTVFSPLEVPVGVFTALAGVPFFLFLLRRLR